MKVEKDFAEFLGLLNKNKVRYLIIGAYAVGFYGYPRFTKDLDILIEPSSANASRVINVLKEFGLSNLSLTIEDFLKDGTIIQLGYDPVRIDLLTTIEGLRFEDMWKNKKAGRYGKQKVFFMGFEDLIESKRRAGRDIDLIDLKKLIKRK
jgi:hypothetical protein